MAHVIADRVSDVTTTTGTGAITVAATPPTGFRTFSAVMTTSDTAHITIVDPATGDWETCKATYTAANELTRSSTDRQSSNSNNAVSFGAGSKTVFLTVIAGSLKGSWYEITRTVASGAATVDFVLPAGYDEYEIEAWGVTPASDQTIILRTSTDGGSTYDSGAGAYKYYLFEVEPSGGTTAYTASNSATSITLAGGISTVESAPTAKARGTIKIADPATADESRITFEWFFQSSAGNEGIICKGQGFRAAAADIDAVRIMAASGNISGTFVLRARRK